ncbi:nicotinate (nicotinamide) nucleotide adenylyltransferase [Luteibaculum oceani]|uniref:Probable nicotinate-nucleotide adenylyltransferase n=1 Tax=Luteibaculum oceani TaxID=1294296 RepID=A0A5C6VI88_9FLAO|nr:nicotinate (nicotinamide) nucleotide adenylyltransferase [Luteibaculum oceani]TXC85202.1 nicotinate-nucleotide adenylyltransferase [Luteibaculum oceani]
MKVALFFGSFNPIHMGHLMLADFVRQNTEVDQLWFVLSPQNPHKKQANLLDDYTRLEMVNLAIEDDDNLRVSDIEFSLPKPSYTAITLAYLKEKYPSYSFYLTLGEDNLNTLHKWHKSDEIIKHHPIIYYPRHTDNQKEKSNEFLAKAHLIRCEAPRIEISSSFIRKQISEGKECRYMLPDKVYSFLKDSNFYR